MERKHNKSLVQNAKELRNNMTKEERHLWYDFLKEYPVRFSRQKILGKYIVDFYSASAKMIIELDGSQHYEETGFVSDKTRDSYLTGLGLTVLRYPNSMIFKDFEGVCEDIRMRL